MPGAVVGATELHIVDGHRAVTPDPDHDPHRSGARRQVDRRVLPEAVLLRRRLVVAAGRPLVRRALCLWPVAGSVASRAKATCRPAAVLLELHHKRGVHDSPPGIECSVPPVPETEPQWPLGVHWRACQRPHTLIQPALDPHELAPTRGVVMPHPGDADDLAAFPIDADHIATWCDVRARPAAGVPFEVTIRLVADLLPLVAIHDAGHGVAGEVKLAEALGALQSTLVELREAAGLHEEGLQPGEALEGPRPQLRELVPLQVEVREAPKMSEGAWMDVGNRVVGKG
mmetsp:Transcript_76737/g.248426  ORF Transcript_76737/g.248426 Transcript_76737/m.248426 type:complete len:286 (-) Transcript_76737:194-1051(-)